MIFSKKKSNLRLFKRFICKWVLSLIEVLQQKIGHPKKLRLCKRVVPLKKVAPLHEVAGYVGVASAKGCVSVKGITFAKGCATPKGFSLQKVAPLQKIFLCKWCAVAKDLPSAPQSQSCMIRDGTTYTAWQIHSIVPSRQVTQWRVYPACFIRLAKSQRTWVVPFFSCFLIVPL